MAVLGFSVPHFLNKFLRYSVQKDKQKQNETLKIYSTHFYKDIDNWLETENF